MHLVTGSKLVAAYYTKSRGQTHPRRSEADHVLDPGDYRRHEVDDQTAVHVLDAAT